MDKKGRKMSKDDKILSDFIQLLEQYKDKEGYNVLDMAYDLFCALEMLAKNHNTLKAKIMG